MRKVKKVKAWADIGSNGNIFYFAAGPTALRYPYLMHIYHRKITPDLIPITITYHPKKER